MDNSMNYSREEMEKLLEKAKAELEATLAKMTPEERAEAERKAQKLIEEDRAAIQAQLARAAQILSETAPKETPKVCEHCGAPAGSGAFCEYCGSPLRKTSL